MVRPHRTLLVLALLLASLWAPSRAAMPMPEVSARVKAVSTRVVEHPKQALTVPACAFDVGDVVFREGIGATVPALGEAVGGYADGPSSGTEITIETSPTGLVTIDPGGESCQLG
jgi:hypothetical protein